MLSIANSYLTMNNGRDKDNRIALFGPSPNDVFNINFRFCSELIHVISNINNVPNWNTDQ